MRVMSLVHATLYDATVAAWKAKYAYNRPRPSEVDRRLTTVVPNPNTPSYPCEYAVRAGAASAVLSYLSPAKAVDFERKAEEAVRSRLVAGTSFPSDVTAGLDLGRRVAAAAIERAKHDNTDAKWDGKMPSDPTPWRGTDPLLPTMGTWNTWILSSGSQLRPAAPTITREMVEEVTQFKPTGEQRRAAIRWGVTSLNAYWNDVASRMIFEYRLEGNLPRVERIYSLLHTALYDADVACFDAKYAYWGTRPNQFDPTFTSLIRTPNMPGYPWGHATKAGAGSAALAYFFPAEGTAFAAAAEECAWSRLWGGVHLKLDNDAGLELGRKIAARGAERFKGDGR
jgi:membrane-associated phospholipid phosphatase